MTLSEDEMKPIIKMLEGHEGVRQFPYTDTTGNLTIGVGRNLTTVGLRMDEVQYMLKNDIREADEELTMQFPWYRFLTTKRQHALINMLFNLGLTRFRTFKKMLIALAEARYDDAANEALDSTWADQVGARSLDIAAMLKVRRDADGGP